MESKLKVFRKWMHYYSGLLIILFISVFFIASNLTEENKQEQKFISPEWNQFHSVSRQDSGTVGVPVDLGPGITLTVAEIMEKEAMLPEAHYKYPKEKVIERKETEENREDLENLKVNPDAPDVSSWPPRNADQKYQEPLQTDNPQTLGTTFLGPQLSTAGYIPPDSQGDVGPTQVFVTSNGRITVYSKAGVVGGLNVGLDAFFSSVDQGTGTSDPHIRYDRLSQRWYVVGINLNSPNRIMIARSSGPTITNTSSFTFFQFQQDQVGVPGADLGGFADYPTLGVDKFALYIGCNMFNGSGTSYLGTSVWVVNKANLNAGTLTVTGFHQISNGSTEGPRTPQGVDNDDPSATEGYFVGVSNFSYSRVTIRRVTNPGGTPVLSGNLNITVPTTTSSQSVPCNGSTNSLDGLDDRLYAAAIHKDKISNTSTLWTAHNFEVNTSGVADASGNRLASRWYQITNLTTTPSLVQSGTVYDNAASNPLNYWIPSCVMSGQGHMAIAYSRAGASNKAEIYASGRLRTDALGTTQANLLLQSSSTNYNVESTTPQRWGDYSQTVVDPNDDMTMWTFQEYCNSSNSWGVRAVQLKAPPPATPSSSNLVNIEVGQPSVNIVITGTSVSGSEFFDPGADAGGPGYANHIAASITGSVTVNSITFNSPTQVSLNISTVGATIGTKNITVTNPDGQTATGNALINIQSIAPKNLNFTALIQGFYDAGTNLTVRDTMKVYVRNSTSPFGILDSGKAYITTTGTGVITFTKIYNSINYYLVFRHRNTLETWSKSPGQSFSSNLLTYDLTTAAAQAYGNNIIQVDNSPMVKFACFSGDVDQDQSIDASDLSIVENASTVSLSGYVSSDCNGDDYVDGSDVSIVENNIGVNIVRP